MTSLSTELLLIRGWEKEKEKLVAEAEEAARRRVASDLEIQRRHIAFEAWKRDLEKERDESHETMATNLQSKEEAMGDHPILGPVIADFGSKRVHATSAKALSAIPVWKKQRIYRHDRAKSMAKDKLKSIHLGLPGVIGLYEVGILITCLQLFSKAFVGWSPLTLPLFYVGAFFTTTGQRWELEHYRRTTSHWYAEDYGRDISFRRIRL